MDLTQEKKIIQMADIMTSLFCLYASLCLGHYDIVAGVFKHKCKSYNHEHFSI